MYIWICSCPVSGQILSVFTALPFPLPSFHLCVFFTLPVLPGSHYLCQCISHEQFLPSFLSKQLLPLCAIPSPCCILSAGGYIKIRTFCRAFLGSLYYFFLLWVRALFRAVVDTLPVLCRLVPLWFLCQHLFLKTMTWNTKPYKLSKIPDHLVV